MFTPAGEVRMGRDYTSTFVPATYFDPFFSAGVASAVNYQPNYKFLPGPNLLLAPGTLVRASNMLGYYIPSTWVPGFYACGQVAPVLSAQVFQAVPGEKPASCFMGLRPHFFEGMPE